MQVRTPSEQHAVMVEAVENHMPEVIVIDEIGTELEALASRTIAERGVQLVATAHGNTLGNLMMNPTLADLIGGIQTVTLSDEEARRRGTRKSVLERKAPPTFGILVEIQSFDRVSIHNDVALTVDALLRGDAVSPAVRELDGAGTVQAEEGESARTPLPFQQSFQQAFEQHSRASRDRFNDDEESADDPRGRDGLVAVHDGTPLRVCRPGSGAERWPGRGIAGEHRWACRRRHREQLQPASPPRSYVRR